MRRSECHSRSAALRTANEDEEMMSTSRRATGAQAENPAASVHSAWAGARPLASFLALRTLSLPNVRAVGSIAMYGGSRYTEEARGALVGGHPDILEDERGEQEVRARWQRRRTRWPGADQARRPGGRREGGASRSIAGRATAPPPVPPAGTRHDGLLVPGDLLGIFAKGTGLEGTGGRRSPHRARRCRPPMSAASQAPAERRAEVELRLQIFEVEREVEDVGVGDRGSRPPRHVPGRRSRRRPPRLPWSRATPAARGASDPWLSSRFILAIPAAEVGPGRRPERATFPTGLRAGGEQGGNCDRAHRSVITTPGRSDGHPQAAHDSDPTIN